MNALNQAISDIGIVPVIKLNNPQRDAAPLAKALCAGGVPVAEVTFRAAGAAEAIKLMKEACPEMIVGAGTVTTKEHIDATIAACGGSYMVTADLIDGQKWEEITKLCKKSREIVDAARLGSAVKDAPRAAMTGDDAPAAGQFSEQSTQTAVKL